jgi:hypothetical protein
MKSYTDIEQSKKLAKILPIESADMWHHGFFNPRRMSKIEYNPPAPYHSVTPQWDCPCWSLAALLSVLPTIDDEFEPQLHRSLDKYRCTYESEEDSSGLWRVANNPVDACVAMIEKLNELKML